MGWTSNKSTVSEEACVGDEALLTAQTQTQQHTHSHLTTHTTVNCSWTCPRCVYINTDGEIYCKKWVQWDYC